MRERLEFYLRDVRGFAYDVVNAVLAAGSNDVVDAISKVPLNGGIGPFPDASPMTPVVIQKVIISDN